MVQKSKILKKNTLLLFLFLKKMPKKEEEKKCYSLSFQILAGRDSTRAL